jgi:translation initiation factor 1
MSKKSKKREPLVYSTNPNYEYEYDGNEINTLKPEEQNLKICIDKHRAGKIAVIIKDFEGSDDDLKSLAKFLKTKCGGGGSAKKGEIIIQGDVRNKIMDILKEKGYNFKRVGG